MSRRESLPRLARFGLRGGWRSGEHVFMRRLTLPSRAVALGSVALLVGCGQDPLQTGPTATASEALFGNDQTSYDYFIGKGLTAVQAAGIVGNLDQESGDSPTAVQDPGAGRGVAQWSAGGRWDTDANDNENWYVTNEDGGAAGIWDLKPQLDFIWYELTTFSSYGLAELQQQTTVDGATLTFMTYFEGCGTCDASNRETYAQNVYDAYGSADYGAEFVAQSFPLATTTLKMTTGQVIPSWIELKNIGTKTWTSETRIGTTEPEDRVSVFADKTWIQTDRPSEVRTGTVAPGATYKFTFDLAAPDKPGTYDEHFGVVQEGVTWFSAAGQGGPPDSDLEVKIEVVAAPSSSASSSSGETTSTSSSSGSGGGAGGAGSGAGVGGTGGSSTAASSSSSSGKVAEGATGSSTSSSSGEGEDFVSGRSSSCAVAAPASTSGSSPATALAAVALGLALSRRRRTR